MWPTQVHVAGGLADTGPDDPHQAHHEHDARVGAEMAHREKEWRRQPPRTLLTPSSLIALRCASSCWVQARGRVQGGAGLASGALACGDVKPIRLSLQRAITARV